ncbi:MAG TPA: ABC transporter permease [Mycobacteriales bacterium]|nr:ABC transporter permease [Mycobacteriales bacterium]
MTTVDGLVEPGRGAGLLDVVRQRFLLRLIVKQELRVRYRGSVLGLFWSYVKPAVQFAVYFFALGVFLRLNRSLEDFAVYLFAGFVVISFFSEAFGNAARSIVRNAPLVRKIYLPRELFPVATTWVAAIHMAPQVVVLLVGALVAGWTPSVGAVLSALLGFAVVAVLVSGLGLVFAAVNVFFRDFENLVDLMLLVVVWLSPVLYPWSFVRDALGDGWLLELYLANPLTVAVQLFQRAFWFPGAQANAQELIPDLFTRGVIALVGSAVVLVVGQLVFARLEKRFAQEL